MNLKERLDRLEAQMPRVEVHYIFHSYISPGDLNCENPTDGTFQITTRGNVILRSKDGELREDFVKRAVASGCWSDGK